MKFFVQDSKEYLNISDDIFSRGFNSALVHQVVTSYKLIGRQGSKAQKNRSEVSGSGKKPWRQKGTGRARVGSIRSPIWRSGGVTFAAKNRSFLKKVNRRMYRGALKSIFSKLLQQDRLIISKEFTITAPKTKLLIDKLRSMKLENVLILLEKMDTNLFFSSRNLSNVVVREISRIDPVILISYKRVLITVDAVRRLEEILI
ncbi:MAG: 50S ribosomal subunit protein L4 [Candidatus Westeberhardia cardiocondylae]|nr:50S ribosomal subunit protein L4 [Candidatus Westeberhardia cardiocondylae]